ncbi:MAG: tripartite tricarboxylate transporter substrate binding protein [Xanthobacteraceae bacterium]
MRWLIALAAVAMLGLVHIGSAAAQSTYPSRTVRFILPYGAGSATDTASRLFADGLSKLWGKPVIVENRPGGDGLVSLSAFAQAKDDHVLWFGPAGAFTALPYMHDTLPFDPSPNMNPVVSTSVVVLAVSVPASLKIDTVSQLVALARSEPGKLNAAAANGISDFLLFGFFKKQGLQVAEVPYRDIMQAPSDLLAGRIQVLSTSLAVPQPLANAGRLKILVVTSKQRAPSQPSVPTAIEAGYPDLTFESIGGVFGPPGMPEELRNRIAADFRKVAAANPDIAKKLATTGQIVSLRSPAEFATAIQEQRVTLAGLAKTLGLKAATH